MNRSIRLGTLLAALLLAACSNLLPKPAALAIYRLPTTTVVTPSSDTFTGVQLRIATPRAAGILAGRRIAVLPEGNRISIYHGARWDQAAPTLLRDRLVQAFRRAGRQQAVLVDNSNLHADYALVSHLEDFQAEVHGQAAPVVVATLEVLLTDPNERHVIATRRFHVEVASDDSAIPTVVDAFGEAGDQLAHDVLAWTWAELAKTIQQANKSP